MDVLFYHLERARLEDVLPLLLEKTLERDWRAIVRGGSEERLNALETHLWSYRDDSFLGHGQSPHEHAARQPILLTAGLENSNFANVLFLVDQPDIAGYETYDRAVLIFDGEDETALSQARAHWKVIQSTDHQVTYWRQSSEGRWEQQ